MSYKESLGLALQEGALDVVLTLVGAGAEDAVLCHETLRMLASLLSHRKFSLVFIESGGLRWCSMPPRPPCSRPSSAALPSLPCPAVLPAFLCRPAFPALPCRPAGLSLPPRLPCPAVLSLVPRLPPWPHPPAHTAVQAQSSHPPTPPPS
jgi:hypothetical protein